MITHLHQYDYFPHTLAYLNPVAMKLKNILGTVSWGLEVPLLFRFVPHYSSGKRAQSR